MGWFRALMCKHQFGRAVQRTTTEWKDGQTYYDQFCRQIKFKELSCISCNAKKRLEVVKSEWRSDF